MTVFFTSDTHFGDHRVLNIRGGRPFASVAQMDAELVARWNARVSPADEVWHLGDVARTPAQAEAVAARLNGAKRLLAGNLDRPPLAGWGEAQAYAELELDGVRLVLCHYPFRSWNGQHRGALNLHGHSHGRLSPRLPRQFDVGVDVHDFRPVTLAELLAAPPPPRRGDAARSRSVSA